MARWRNSILDALAAGQGDPVRDPAEAEQAMQGAAGWLAGAPGGIRDLGETLLAGQSMAQGTPHPVAMAQLEEGMAAPGGTDWLGEQMGADPTRPEFQMASMASADPFGKLGGALTAGLGLIGSVGKHGGNLFENLFGAGDEAAELATEVSRYANQNKVRKDYENDVTFVEMDTVDPQVDARIKTTGQYRGAPRGVDKPQRLGSMRRNLWDLLDRGAPGRDWYQQSAEMAGSLTGDRPNFKHLIAGSNAITSRGAAVPANRVFGVRGFNQAITGRPVDAGRFPAAQGEAIDQLASGQTYYGGPKETPFYEGLTIDERAEGIRPTNDLWMARAFGYTRPDGSEWGEGLGRAQHRFMDKEINHLVQKANEAELGGFTDWTPEKVQAAIWVAKKAQMEGTTVAKAAEDFSHGLENLTGNIRYEANPSSSLDHMGDYGQSDEYMDIVQAMTQDEQGRNVLALEGGALTRPGDRGYVRYEGNTSPSMSARILMAPETGSAQIEGASMDLGKGIAAGHGLALGQDTAGITTFRPAKSAADRNIARVPYEDTSPGGMKELEDALNEQFGPGEAFPVHTPDGVEIAYVGDLGGKEFTKGVTKIFGRGKADFGVNSGGLVGNKPWEEGPTTSRIMGSGESGFRPSAWMEEIDAANLGPAEARIERGTVQLAEQMDKVDTALEAAGIGQRDEILTETRRILIREGFAGIRKAVEAGILPAVVLSVVGAGAMSAGGDDGQVGGV